MSDSSRPFTQEEANAYLVFAKMAKLIRGKPIDRMMECDVCLLSAAVPKNLPCEHAVCYRCLVKYIQENYQCEPEEFKCPKCPYMVKVPPGGIMHLPMHTDLNEVLSLVTEGDSYQNRCKKHPRADTRYFCSTCKCVVCKKCAEKKHMGHNVADDNKKLLRDMLEKVEKRIESVRKQKEDFEQEGENITKRKEEMEEEINEQYETVVKAINEQRKKCLDDIDEHNLELLKTFDDIKLDLFRRGKILETADDFATDILAYSNDVEISTYWKELEVFMTQILKKELPNICPDVPEYEFKPAAAGRHESIMGEIKTPGETCERTMYPFYLPSRPKVPQCLKHGQRIRSFDTRIKQDNKFPKIAGLAISKENEYLILDSANKCVKIFTNRGQRKITFGNNILEHPTNIAIFGDEYIAVSDWAKIHCLQYFTNTGQHSEVIKKKKISYPVGFAITSKNTIILGTRGKPAEVNIHSQDGTFISIVSSTIQTPYNICIDNFDDGTETIIISDQDDNSIKGYKASGDMVYQYVNEVSPEHSRGISSPRGVTTDDKGNIFVADHGNNRIQVLNRDGTFKQTMVSRLPQPLLVAIDKEGHLVVATEKGSVHVYEYMEPKN